ncbi:UNVERIFIED_CONTAM: hypothetical protein FKN15_070335 [Acipenser sinensis]
MAQSSPSSTEETGSQRVVKAGGDDEVRKSRFPVQAGRMDKMGECGTTQDQLARSMDNGKEEDQFLHQLPLTMVPVGFVVGLGCLRFNLCSFNRGKSPSYL